MNRLKIQQQNLNKYLDLSSLIDYCFFLDGIIHRGLVGSLSSEGVFLELPDTWNKNCERCDLTSVQISCHGECLNLDCEIAYINTDCNSFFPIGIGLVFQNTDVIKNLS